MAPATTLSQVEWLAGSMDRPSLITAPVYSPAMGNGPLPTTRARALTVLTVSDHLKTGERTSAQDREQTFGQMVEIALETIIT